MHQTTTRQRALEAVSDVGRFSARDTEWDGIHQFIDFAARCSVNVLICGGNRRLRETLARLIHQDSARRDEPFIVVDFQGTPNHRVSSPPLGSIFVEEAQDLSSSMQASLLGILDQQLRSPGTLRVMAGATPDLFDKARSGIFSADMFYRLNLIHLVIEPHGVPVGTGE